MLRTGSNVEVQIRQDGRTIRFASVVTHWGEGEVFIEAPADDALWAPLSKNTPVTLRLPTIEYQTALLHLRQYLDVPVWVLRDPDLHVSGERDARRIHTRTAVDLAAQMELFGGGTGGRIWAQMEELSVDGARLAIRQQLPLEQRMLLRFQLSLEGPPHTLRARVVRTAGNEGETFFYGIQFIDPAVRVTSEILQYQNALWQKPPRPLAAAP